LIGAIPFRASGDAAVPLPDANVDPESHERGMVDRWNVATDCDFAGVAIGSRHGRLRHRPLRHTDVVATLA
jgi:hypothetical protein